MNNSADSRVSGPDWLSGWRLWVIVGVCVIVAFLCIGIGIISNGSMGRYIERSSKARSEVLRGN